MLGATLWLVKYFYVRICKSKDRQHNGQKKRTENTMAKRIRTKGQTTIYKALHIKLNLSFDLQILITPLLSSSSF
jgi:hypothetical protein